LPLPRGLSTTLRFCLLLPTPIISLSFCQERCKYSDRKAPQRKASSPARPLCAAMRSSS
jgi:hypothetical protein